MSGVDLVIFDCDGVLVDSEGPANRVLAEFLSEHGLPLTPAQSEARFRGYKMAQIGTEVLERDNIRLPDDWEDAFYARCLPVLEREVEPVRFAVETVEAVRELGIGSCVASQGRIEKMRVTLMRTGLWPHFEGRAFSSTMVRRGKPAPDLFLYAAHKMRAPFDRCLVVEDSAAGVKAAVNAGMRCLALCAPDQAGDMAALGAEPIESLMEVPWSLA